LFYPGSFVRDPLAALGARTTVPTSTFRGAIEYTQVHFGYSPEQPVLRGLSLTISGGRFVGLVGSTGSGKSTVIKMLLGFYRPDAGEIRLGGRPLHDLPVNELRRHIAWVGQETFLFHGTIHENIALGAPGADRAAVIAAARAAELHEFIQTLPQGYDTLVGDFGSTLSGGQRQRLSIARAVLKDPAILILDEATSAVDNDTEAAIQRSIARVSRGRTVIAVAHRLSTVRPADEIFVLEGGQILEHGTHQSLLAEGGRYARLWAMQIGEDVAPNGPRASSLLVANT
jgi:ATP-binding cassette subfamily B protein